MCVCVCVCVCVQGVSDQLELLALRATQLSANLTTLTAAHQETGEKVAGLVRWQAKQAAAAAAATRRSADGAATSEVDGAAAGALRNNSGGFASMATNMGERETACLCLP